jgi:asparagine synthase (glutamine-hydrolysing)
LMQDSRLAALGIIEPAAVQVSLDKMIAGISVSLGPLNMLIATELWLRRLR